MPLHYDQLPAKLKAAVDAAVTPARSSPRRSRREAQGPGLPVRCACGKVFAHYGAATERHVDHDHTEAGVRVECILDG